MRTINKLFYWFRDNFIRNNSNTHSQINHDYKYSFLDDIPTNFERKTIYVVGSIPWLIIIECPCGCSDLIYLNLIKKEEPFWEFEIKNDLLSISPSIWRTKGCQSHFYIRKNNIRWCDCN